MTAVRVADWPVTGGRGLSGRARALHGGWRCTGNYCVLVTPEFLQSQCQNPYDCEQNTVAVATIGILHRPT